ncbi:MAG: PadR family transcriptional regulator [Acidobacteriota bacterium]|nr:PadR family transcriptional regulator [Acidobacteriota bacterium]
MEPRAARTRLELLQGTLDLLILQTLQWGPQHGYAIGHTIRAQSSEALQVETGSLYPALHRLQKQGWVKSDWQLTDAKQRAKFYRLTPAGKKQLLRERNKWEQLVVAIGGVLNPGPERG